MPEHGNDEFEMVGVQAGHETAHTLLRRHQQAGGFVTGGHRSVDVDHGSPLPELRLAAESEIAGINYQARGSGPPVIFFPLHLAPSQWEPVLPALAERFCTITLGGPHLGFASILEQRAEGGYGAVVADLIDAMGLMPGAVGSTSDAAPGLSPAD
jgi:hypothetical protein